VGQVWAGGDDTLGNAQNKLVLFNAKRQGATSTTGYGMACLVYPSPPAVNVNWAMGDRGQTHFLPGSRELRLAPFPPGLLSLRVGNPVEGERDSGMILNSVPG
jgi:hypothetical protein